MTCYEAVVDGGAVPNWRLVRAFTVCWGVAEVGWSGWKRDGDSTSPVSAWGAGGPSASERGSPGLGGDVAGRAPEADSSGLRWRDRERQRRPRGALAVGASGW